MSELEVLQTKAAKYILFALWGIVLVLFLTGFVLGSENWLVVSISGLLIAGGSSFQWMKDPNGKAFRYLTSVALPALIGFWVYEYRGHFWQIDIHMSFFAVLALTAIYCDKNAILISAATIAVHHLVLNFVMPAAVFPEGADFMRVVLHAVIIIIETAFLYFLSNELTKAFQLAAEAVKRSKADADKAIEASAQTRMAAEKSDEALKALEVSQEETKSLMSEQENFRKDAESQRRQEVSNMANELESTIQGVSDSLVKYSANLEKSANSLADLAESGKQHTGQAAEAADISSGNIQSVASAVEELSSSIRDISRQSDVTTSLSSNAVVQAEKTGNTIRTLADQANKIRDVLKLISDISEQTNLLALNATIEAARAGEAGKGFAVVASEVKNLATQTADATEEIEEQISSMYKAAQDAVVSIDEISKIINEGNDSTEVISSSISEQNAATGEISANAQSAAANTLETTENIVKVQGISEVTGNTATEILDAAHNISSQSGILSSEIETILSKLRVQATG